MKLAVVCPFDLSVPGGGQAHTTELTRRLLASGVEAFLVAPGRVPEGVPGISLGPGTPVRANRSVAPIVLRPAAIGLVRRALRGADLVHVHEPFMPLAGPAAVTSSLPGVATFHADPPPWVRWTYRRLSPMLARLLEGKVVSAVSPVAASALPRSWGPAEIIPIAIDVAGYRVGVERVDHRVVFVGRDDRRKGLDVLLSAWPRIRSRVEDAELVVVGAERPDRIRGVVWMGRLAEEEKRRVLGSAAVLAAPNLSGESFGTVVAEGMAAGCAVVCSDLPAFRWVLGGAGRFVRAGDRESLATAIVELLIDVTERKKMVEAGSRRVAEFDWSTVLARYLAQYRRVAKG